MSTASDAAKRLLGDPTIPKDLWYTLAVQEMMKDDEMPKSPETSVGSANDVVSSANEKEGNDKLDRVMRRPSGERLEALRAELKDGSDHPIDSSITRVISESLSKMSSSSDPTTSERELLALIGACNQAQLRWFDFQEALDRSTAQSKGETTAASSSSSNAATSMPFTKGGYTEEPAGNGKQ